MGGDLAGQAKKRDVIETSGIIWDINGIEGDIYIMYIYIINTYIYIYVLDIASNTGRFMGKNAGHKWGGGVSRVICFFFTAE